MESFLNSDHFFGKTQEAFMTEVYITYPGNASIRFERGYYSKEHLPLVKRHWEKYGLGLAFPLSAFGDGI